MKTYHKLIMLGFLFCVVMVYLGGCSKGTDEIDQILKTVVLEESAEVIEKEVFKWPTYFDNTYHWEVQYRIHINEHHPNGYVIITKITKKQTTDEIETWTLNYDTDNYIEEIHYNLKAKHRDGGYEENNVFLPSNDNFKHAFRTAETILIAWEMENKINPIPKQAVIEARERMKGRKVGIAR